MKCKQTFCYIRSQLDKLEMNFQSQKDHALENYKEDNGFLAPMLMSASLADIRYDHIIHCKICQPERASEKTQDATNWNYIKKVKPPDHQWVLLGKWLDQSEGFSGMVWQIGRHIPATGLEFYNKLSKIGAFQGDSEWDFEPNETTHWMGINYSDSIVNEMRCAEPDGNTGR
jgi:hypothetical protein